MARLASTAPLTSQDTPVADGESDTDGVAPDDGHGFASALLANVWQRLVLSALLISSAHLAADACIGYLVHPFPKLTT